MSYLLTGSIIVIGIIAVALIGWIIKVYNFYIYNRTKVDEKYAQVEVALKKKYDAIPAFTDSVKGYVKHEKNTLSKVTALSTPSI